MRRLGVLSFMQSGLILYLAPNLWFRKPVTLFGEQVATMLHMLFAYTFPIFPPSLCQSLSSLGVGWTMQSESIHRKR